MKRGSLRILEHRLHNLSSVKYPTLIAEHPGIDLMQHPGILIRLAPEHHTVEQLQVITNRVERSHAAIKDKRQIRKITLEQLDEFVAQRRYFPILLRTEPGKPGRTGVDDKTHCAAVGNRTDKIPDKRIIENVRSTPIRCLTVIGKSQASRIARTQSRTSSGSFIKHAPNAPR